MVSHYERFSHSLLAKKYCNNNHSEVVSLASDSSVIESPTATVDFENFCSKKSETKLSNSVKSKTSKKAVRTKTISSCGATKPKRSKVQTNKNAKQLHTKVHNNPDSVTTDDSEKWPVAQPTGPGFTPHEPTTNIVADFSLKNLNPETNETSDTSTQELFSSDIVKSATECSSKEMNVSLSFLDQNVDFCTSTQAPSECDNYSNKIPMDTTSSFALSPRRKNNQSISSHSFSKLESGSPSSKKSKQGDIGSMLFGLNPLASKNINKKSESKVSKEVTYPGMHH